MFDMFTIGFSLFVLEADHIVKVESREGLKYMWIAIGLNIVLDAVFSFSIYRYVNQIKEQELASAKAIVDNIKTYQN